MLEKIEKMLVKLLENQEKMQGDISSMQGDISSMQGDISSMQGDISSMQGDISSMQGDISSMQGNISSMQGDISSMQGNISNMQKEITKQGIIQEKMARDIELLAEGHKTILEQNDRQHNEIRKEFNDRLEEVETAITNLSEDVAFIKHKEYENEQNIFKLKENFKKGKSFY